MKECWQNPRGTWLRLVLWQQGHWELLSGAQQDSGKGTLPSASGVKTGYDLIQYLVLLCGRWRSGDRAGTGIQCVSVSQTLHTASQCLSERQTQRQLQVLTPSQQSISHTILRSLGSTLSATPASLMEFATSQNLPTSFQNLFLLCQTSLRQRVYTCMICSVNLHLLIFT